MKWAILAMRWGNGGNEGIVGIWERVKILVSVGMEQLMVFRQFQWKFQRQYPPYHCEKS